MKQARSQAHCVPSNLGIIDGSCASVGSKMSRFLISPSELELLLQVPFVRQPRPQHAWRVLPLLRDGCRQRLSCSCTHT